MRATPRGFRLHTGRYSGDLARKTAVRTVFLRWSEPLVLADCGDDHIRAGSRRITENYASPLLAYRYRQSAISGRGNSRTKKARSTIESRNKWVPQLHEPRPVRVGATCVVFRWPSEPTRGVASGVAALRSLHWQLRSYSGPETCGGHSIPGIVPVLPSSEAVTKAVGGRSAGGMETSSGSLRRGTCDAVNEPSSTGRIQGMDRVTA